MEARHPRNQPLPEEVDPIAEIRRTLRAPFWLRNLAAFDTAESHPEWFRYEHFRPAARRIRAFQPTQENEHGR